MCCVRLARVSFQKARFRRATGFCREKRGGRAQLDTCAFGEGRSFTSARCRYTLGIRFLFQPCFLGCGLLHTSFREGWRRLWQGDGVTACLTFEEKREAALHRPTSGRFAQTCFFKPSLHNLVRLHPLNRTAEKLLVMILKKQGLLSCTP